MRLIPVSFLAVLALAVQSVLPSPFAAMSKAEMTSLFEAAADNDAAAYRFFTVAGPQSVTYRDMVRAIARHGGLPRPVFLPVPRVPSYWAAQLLRYFWPRSPVDPDMIRRHHKCRRLVEISWNGKLYKVFAVKEFG